MQAVKPELKMVCKLKTDFQILIKDKYIILFGDWFNTKYIYNMCKNVKFQKPMIQT